MSILQHVKGTLRLTLVECFVAQIALEGHDVHGILCRWLKFWQITRSCNWLVFIFCFKVLFKFFWRYEKIPEMDCPLCQDRCWRSNSRSSVQGSGDRLWFFELTPASHISQNKINWSYSYRNRHTFIPARFPIPRGARRYPPTLNSYNFTLLLYITFRILLIT